MTKVNHWKFSILEISANCYSGKAVRITGENIAITGSLSIVSGLLQEAFKVEVGKGVMPGEAAFSITSSYLHGHNRVYHEDSFGSWTVGNLAGSPSIDYDGRDYYLMVCIEKDRYAWQGDVYDLAKGRCKYFDCVVNFPDAKL